MEFRKIRRAAASLAAAAVIAAAIPMAAASADNSGARTGSKSHGVQMIYTNIYSKETGKVIASNGKGKNFITVGKDHSAYVKVNLGGAYAGVNVTLYRGKDGSIGAVDEAVLDENGCAVFKVKCGKNYALSIDGEADPDFEASAAADEASDEAAEADESADESAEEGAEAADEAAEEGEEAPEEEAE